MTTSLTLGALRLVGTPLGNGEVITTVSAKDGASTMFLTPSEWQSLLAVSAVVEAAREWRRVRTGMHTNGPQHTLAMQKTARELEAAIDALPAKDHP